MISASFGSLSITECSMLIQSGIRPGDTGFDDDVIHEAESKQHRGASIGALLEASIEASGDYFDWRSIQGGQIMPMWSHISASTTLTRGISNALSRLASKSVSKGYGSVRPAFRSVAKMIDDDGSRSRHEHEHTVMVAKPMQPTGREIRESVWLGDTYPVGRLVEHGEELSLTEESIVNDDIGVFAHAGVLFGQSAAQRIELSLAALVTEAQAAAVPTGQPRDGMWLFVDDYADEHLVGNYLSGGASALSSSSFASAASRIARQRSSAGQPLDLEPSHLIVTATNKQVAKSIRQSQALDSSEAIAAISTGWWQASGDEIANPVADASWLLAAVTDHVAPLLIRGSTEPDVRTYQGPVNQLGLVTRAAMSVRCAYMDPRCVVFAAGS